jgi:alkaline phosphatase
MKASGFSAFILTLLVAMQAMADVPRNVVLFIGDGMSTPQRMVAEEFLRKSGKGPLAMNSLPCHATVCTYSASSLVTDSAAAATAIACGVKTTNGTLGLDANGARVESCAEAARDSGRKVGIMTSVSINHATPAGFYAHRGHRSMLYEIGLDLVNSKFDLFMGGGLAGANSRTDSPEYAGNLYEMAASKGWIVAEGRNGFSDLEGRLSAGNLPDGAGVWWRSGEQAQPYAIDMRGEDMPRLPEMTRFALDYLHCRASEGGEDKGFFLMVEGGRIDWAGHSNDAAANLRDVLELDEAVKVALAFQRENPDTLIIVTGDHETGGMSLGFSGTGYAFYVERLEGQKCSADSFAEKAKSLKDGGAQFEDVKPLVSECFGFRFDGGTEDPMSLSGNEIASLERHFAKGDIADKAKRLMSEKAGVGWTSGAHTGLPALTTSKGPGSEHFTGMMENTDISKTIKSFW